MVYLCVHVAVSWPSDFWVCYFLKSIMGTLEDGIINLVCDT